MRLTQFTDYALRLLLFAATHAERLVTIEETARLYGVSRHHMMKIANQLTREGILQAVRGRSGGLRLTRPADEIGLGRIIRLTEPDFALVECFGGANACLITPSCRLKGVLGRGLAAFLAEMDRYTLADLAMAPAAFVRGGGPSPAGAADRGAG